MATQWPHGRQQEGNGHAMASWPSTGGQWPRNGLMAVNRRAMAMQWPHGRQQEGNGHAMASWLSTGGQWPRNGLMAVTGRAAVTETVMLLSMATGHGNSLVW